MGKAKQCFVYNTKIIETPTTKEVYFYETPIYSHSNSDSKTSNTQAHKRKVFDEMSAHKQYDSLKRKQKHYEQTRWEIARIVDCNFDNKTKFLTLTFRENIQDITITNKEFKYFYTTIKLLSVSNQSPDIEIYCNVGETETWSNPLPCYFL